MMIWFTDSECSSFDSRLLMLSCKGTMSRTMPRRLLSRSMRAERRISGQAGRPCRSRYGDSIGASRKTPLVNVAIHHLSRRFQWCCTTRTRRRAWSAQTVRGRSS